RSVEHERETDLEPAVVGIGDCRYQGCHDVGHHVLEVSTQVAAYWSYLVPRQQGQDSDCNNRTPGRSASATAEKGPQRFIAWHLCSLFRSGSRMARNVTPVDHLSG